jgi:Protein of unknown function (DUF2934)
MTDIASHIQEIRAHAYQLWQAAGEPDGEAERFWHEAEKELLAERAKQGDVPPGLTDNLPV